MQTYASAADFLKVTQSYFETDETLNGSILGTALRLRDRPSPAGPRPYLATAHNENGDLLLAAAMTPPNRLLLAGDPNLPQPVLDDLCADLHASGRTVPGVQAVDELAARFAETWQRLTGRPYCMHLHMRAYAVDKVISPGRPAAGALRLATPADLDLLVPWRAAFELESLNEQPPENLRELLSSEIEEGKLYVWVDGVPVSTAACTRPTRRGIWIFAVFTPPEYRGRGYASTCVAALSQQWLDAGKSVVSLYTVIDYPTSNHIYQQIGYRPVGDFSVLQF